MAHETSAIIPQELKYKYSELFAPQTILRKIYPRSGSQTITISPTAQSECVFELPSDPMSLGNSFLTFAVLPTAAGAGFHNHFADHTFPYAYSIQLYPSKSTERLVDITDLAKYLDVVVKAEMPMDEFLAQSDLDMLHPSNSLNTDPKALHLENAVSLPADKNYVEPAYTLSGGANTATPVRYVQFKLSNLYNTILAMKKILYFGGQTLYLRIMFGPGNAMGFYSSSGNDPCDTPVALAQNVVLSNVQLHLAIVDQGNDLYEKLVNKDMKVIIPAVRCYKQAPTASTQQTISHKLTLQDGLQLKRIYHAVYHQTESASTIFDHSNRAGAKVSEYFTSMDGKRLQDYNLLTSTTYNTLDNRSDWEYMRNNLKNSVLQDYKVFQHNWFHMDSWDGLSGDQKKNLADMPLENIKSGLDLLKDRKYDFVARTIANNAYNHYTFVIVLNEVELSKNGIFINRR